MSVPPSHPAALGTSLLAQSGSVDIGATILWSAVIVVLLGILFWSLTWLRKHLKEGADGASGVPAAGFTLADIRQLYKDGKMSSEEYERAKAKVLASAKAAAEVRPSTETNTPKDIYREL